MANPIQYIFLNKSLSMSVGKAAAQAVHACMLANIYVISDNKRELWAGATHKTVIVLEARNEAHMRSIIDYLNERGFEMVQVVDEGVNEIDPHTVTALATGILDKDAEETKLALSTFSLYKEVARLTVEFER